MKSIEIISQDVFYIDIDYMDEYRDFTYNSDGAFAGLPQYMNETHQKYGLRWSLILDPAIQANDSQYLAFDDGYKNDVYVKWPQSVNVSMRHNPVDVPTDRDVNYGQVWPNGAAAFPDFFKKATADWWKKWISYMYNDLGLKFDAIWIVSVVRNPIVCYDERLSPIVGHERAVRLRLSIEQRVSGRRVSGQVSD